MHNFGEAGWRFFIVVNTNLMWFFWSSTYNNQIDWYKILSIVKWFFLWTFLGLKHRVHSDSFSTDIVQKIVSWES